MQVRAAVLTEHGKNWQIEQITLDDPGAGEVLVRVAAAGLCHSDEHVRVGDTAGPGVPCIGGHEGAGVVERVGPGVTKVAVGDHVALAFIPACGTCWWCSRGHQNLCDQGALIGTGRQVDGSSRHHLGAQDLALMCCVGSFAEYTIVSENAAIPVPRDLPLEAVALVSCGVATGWGSAVYSAGVAAGDTVVVFGIGGVGANALQGARMAGAQHVVAVEPAPFNREQAGRFGATHTAASAQQALDLVTELTWGRMAESAIITVDVATPTIIRDAMSVVGKRGTVVLTALGPRTNDTVQLPMHELTLYEKRVVGALFGSNSPRADIPRLLEFYRQGRLKLDELITRRYPLEEINLGYEDMREHRNIRGVITPLP